MGIRLLIDEDLQDKALVASLKSAGHDVTTAGDEGLAARSDPEVLSHACSSERVLLTRNASHFRELHLNGRDHSGIFAVFRERDNSKNMNNRDIARAISRLESAGVPLAGEFISLNAWR